MSQNKWFRRAAGAALACASVVSIAPLGGPSAPAVSAQSADPGGEFHPLTPTRILDTRYGIGDVAPLGAKPQSTNAVGSSAGEFNFNPLGKGGMPTDAGDVLAMVANFTVTQPGSDGWVAVYPRGFEFGGPTGDGQISSLVNFRAGDSVPNLGIVGLDSNGDMTINAAGLANTKYHLIIDVVGFISTSQYDGLSVGGRLEVVDPGRILDTRKTNRPIKAGESRPQQIRGVDTILDDSNSPIRQDIVPNRPTVTAVLVNLTLVNLGADTVPTHITATPNKINTKLDNPSSSNVGPNRIKANMAVVPIAADGSIQLFNQFGNLHVVVDVLGYFEQGIHATGNRGRVVPLDAPFRAFDTREAAFGDAPLQHGSQEEWSFENFVGSVVLNPDSASPINGPAQQGLIGSLVAVNLQPLYPSHVGGTYSSFLRLAPANGAPADVSNVNFFLGDIVPNMSLVKYGTSGSDTHVVEAFNAYGKVDYLLDVYAIVLDD
jgi:hypothetical protein